MYICIDKKREVRLKRIFHSFTVVSVFKVFCEKRFLVCSTSTGMYIEAPLDYPINCSGLFILEICSTSVYHLENQQNFIGTNPRDSTLPRD